MDTRYNKKNRIIIERVIHLRQEKGWNQEQFANAIAEQIGKPITQAAISMWESRKRNVPLKYLTVLADIFGVTEEYLLGTINKKTPHSKEEDTYKVPDTEMYKIEFWQLYAYDKQPVYLDFSKNHEHENGWAIYNRSRSIFIFADDMIKEATIQRLGVDIYIKDISRLYDPFMNKKSIAADKILSVKKCYVEMITTDRYIKGLYNGWYKPVRDPKDELNGVLINEEGLVLPISGLKKSFYAYTYNDQPTKNIKLSLGDELVEQTN